MVCSLLTVPLQMHERPLSPLGRRRAAGSAAAVGPPVVPIRVLLSLSGSVWLVPAKWGSGAPTLLL